MTRSILAALLAACIAGAGTAAPARAQNGDLARMLTTVTTLAILGAVIANDDDGSPKRSTRERRRAEAAERERQQAAAVRERQRAEALAWERQRAAIARERSWDAQPPVWAARWDRAEQPPSGYRRASRQVAIPQSCQRRIRTDDGRRTVYDAGCLRQHGFAVARARR